MPITLGLQASTFEQILSLIIITTLLARRQKKMDNRYPPLWSLCCLFLGLAVYLVFNTEKRHSASVLIMQDHHDVAAKRPYASSYWLGPAGLA